MGGGAWEGGCDPYPAPTLGQGPAGWAVAREGAVSVWPEPHGRVIAAQRVLRGGAPVTPTLQKGRLRHGKAFQPGSPPCPTRKSVMRTS